MCVGVCTILHGYGAMRGIPVGRQFASGSSLDCRLSMSAFAAGQQGNGFAFSQALGQIAHRSATLPDTREIGVSIGQARRGTMRRCVARPYPLRIGIRAAPRRRR